MKGKSVHIKNMRIKQLCNHKVRDFAMAFTGAKTLQDLRETGPRTSLLKMKKLCLYNSHYEHYRAVFN